MHQWKVVQVIQGNFPLLSWVAEHLEKAGVHFVVHHCWSKRDLYQYARDAEIIWAYGGRRGLLEGQNLEVLEHCRVILRSGSGTDNVDKETATSLGILVVNTPDAVTESVADHTISLLFSLVRRVTYHDRQIRRGVWDSYRALSYRSYRGAIMGFVGFGRIPRCIVQKLSGFDMNFVAYDPYRSQEEIAEHGAQKVELDDLLQKADYVSLHCPLTKSTVHLISERELKLMRPDSLLINMSRGQVIDQLSLVEALRKKSIAGAALDVLRDEPPEKEEPLLAMDQVILTPHSGGHSQRFPQELCEASVKAILEICQGQVPASVVNPEVLADCRLIKLI